MVEPLHLHHHAPVPRLPQHLDLPDVRPVAPARREEDGAVVDVEAVLPPLDRAEEELLGLSLPARPSVSLPAPLPQLAAFLRGELMVGGPRCAARAWTLQHAKLPSPSILLSSTLWWNVCPVYFWLRSLINWIVSRKLCWLVSLAKIKSEKCVKLPPCKTFLERETRGEKRRELGNNSVSHPIYWIESCRRQKPGPSSVCIGRHNFSFEEGRG